MAKTKTKVPDGTNVSNVTSKKQSDVKIETNAKEVPSNVVENILVSLPNRVFTKDLSERLRQTDGGKRLRIHLRKILSNSHEHGTAWIFDKEKDKVLLIEIISHFVKAA